MRASESIPRAWSGKDGIHVEMEGRSWVLRRPASLEELWDAMDDTSFNDDHIPYWTELWPSSLALAYWLYARKDEIAGETCLDLGCGLGFTALVGQYLGAKMIAIDHEIEALRFGRANAFENGIQQPVWLAMDWRRSAFSPKKIRHIWAGDIVYEKRFMKPVVEFMESVLEESGTAWFAEPGRKIFDDFLKLLGQRGWAAREVLGQRLGALYPQSSLVGVHVWEISRGRPL